MKNWRISIILILAVTGLISVYAQDFQFAAFTDYYGGIEASEGYEHLRSRIFMQPSFSGYEDNTGLEWYLSARLWVQLIGDQPVIDRWDILQEVYLLYPADYFDLAIGQKLMTYGFADLYGPLNVLHSAYRTPYSLDDAYDSRKPDPAVQLQIYPTFEDTIEICYIPVTRPDTESAFPVSFDEISGSVDWSDAAWLEDSLHSVVANYRHYGERFDIQLLYGWYVEQTPDFNLDEEALLQGSDLVPVYNRKQTIGAAYATRLGGTTLSQDIAFNLTDNFDGSEPGEQYSDITVNTQLLVNLPGGILSQYWLVYSYFFNFGNYESDLLTDALVAEINSFHNQPLQHIAFAVAHLEKTFFREKMKAQVNIGYLHPNVYIAPRVAYNLTDYWALETGMDYTTGDPPEKDFRRNPHNDNFYVRVIFRY